MMDTPGLLRSAPSSARPNDAELVARCCSGDRAAWRSLYERHSAQVYRFLSAMGVRDVEREDACQDVFLAVYRSLPSFRGDSQLSTWIYRITSRTTGKLIQKKRLRQAITTLLDVNPAPQMTSDPAEDTARSLVLERMLDRLNPKKRTVLVLFELEGVPVEEISRIVGCPTNTVWSRLHHARLELTKMAERMKPARGVTVSTSVLSEALSGSNIGSKVTSKVTSEIGSKVAATSDADIDIDSDSDIDSEGTGEADMESP